ncbi:MAG TPA: RluA family pseudouridine synthase [Vicinamibacteria bacterium]|nr:RluA family pseudouridine synthase [Vicinamibacteria bacterium]
MTPTVLTVEAGEAGERLDRWLAVKLPALSRARLQALIEKGAVRVDGGSARASSRVKVGQSVEVTVPPPAAAEPQPEDIPLRVLHEDSRLLVVDKPAGLVVHPGAGTAAGTLVNALLHRVKDLSGIGGVLRPGIVHRLDRGTSGLLVVAKDDATHRDLARQFAARGVEKEYLAVVLGRPRRATGTIDAAIGRDPVHRQRMSVLAPRGRAARTSYAVAEALEGVALLHVRIHTGRTHQIRVHLASIGHPVLGDAVYGGRRLPASAGARLREALAGLDRPALHAARLAFTHPATGQRVSFESPLPGDLVRLLETLRG